MQQDQLGLIPGHLSFSGDGTIYPLYPEKKINKLRVFARNPNYQRRTKRELGMWLSRRMLAYQGIPQGFAWFLL